MLLDCLNAFLVCKTEMCTHKYVLWTSLWQDKCEQYWPSSINESWNVGGSLTVTLVEQRPYAEYKVKILTVEDVSSYN